MDTSTADKRPENPIRRANWLSRITLWYSIPTFVLGFQKKINIHSIYETLPEHKSSYLGDVLELNWRQELKRAQTLKRKPSLRRVLIKIYGVPYLCYGLALAFCELGVKVVQPIALGYFIAYYDPNQTEISLSDTYMSGSVIIICSFLRALFKNTTSVGTYVLGMKAKIACSSLIYRKALRLRKDFIEKAGSGQTINLITTDVTKFDNFAIFANYLWISPIQITIITYFMYRQVGLSSMVGLLTLAVVIPMLFFLGNKLYIYRLNSASKTDLRINVMNEIVKGSEAIKMYTWEKQFVNIVDLIRRNEIKFLRKTSYTKGIILAFKLCLNHLALYATILIYALLYHTFDAEQVFVLISYYNVLKLTLTMSFGYGITSVAELLISIGRMNEFLLVEENHEKVPTDLLNSTTSFSFSKDYSVEFSHGTVTCSNASMNNILQDVNLKVTQGALIAVVGPAGSGKSSLLFSILKELPLTSGDLSINGTVSYAAQESWIFPTSVRQNILFGLPMNKSRYRKVIKCCALKHDIALLSHGDKTLIGERGINLSGGQKARVNLARAVYKDADIYLLDDPLSAVDTRVGKELFEKCIYKFLQNKTVIFVTHQLQYLKNVDNIVVLANGTVKKQGDFSTLQKSSVEFASLLKKDLQDKMKIDDLMLFSSKKENEETLGMYSNSSVEDASIEEPKQIEEQCKSGSVSKSLYKVYFTAGSSCCFLFLHAILFVAASVSPNVCTYFLTYWVNSIELIKQNSTAKEIENITSSFQYLEDFNRNVYIYSTLVVATFIISMIRSLWFYSICMKSSIKLHDRMFRGIIRANMRFFNINSSGRILNRFSRDTGIVDESLADNMLALFDMGFVMFSSIILIATVNSWLAIPNLVYCCIFYLVRFVNLMTNTGIKRLEAVTKSPVITYANVSIQGLSTIRAFGVQPILKQEYDNHQDLYSSTLYTLIVTERAMSLFVDLIGVLYIAVIVMSFPILQDDFLAGNVGIVISLAMGLTTSLQFCVKLFTQVETQMTSVERILEFASTEPEGTLETKSDKRPPKSWLPKGKIEFINVYLRYSADDSAILKNLNFTIQPLEKIGIVGRTGAGKSSIIKALFRLAETSGSIIVDKTEIHTLGLHDLRSKISIIPQHPFFISGSLRKNLDPFNNHTDDVLWTALEEVDLKKFIANLPLGFETQVLDCASNFSVGQKQLICLARAIVCNNKILVLDEATANIDLKTDALIQKTIKQKFRDCTVLTIAHRLNTVMNSDKIMVLDAGRLVEFDHSYILLQKPNGFFYSMVQQTGEESVQLLTTLAEKYYRELHQLPERDLIVFQ